MIKDHDFGKPMTVMKMPVEMSELLICRCLLLHLIVVVPRSVHCHVLRSTHSTRREVPCWRKGQRRGRAAPAPFWAQRPVGRRRRE